MSEIATDQLIDQGDWDRFRGAIDSTGDNAAVGKLIDQLKALGVKSAIIEQRYLDQDFTELYSKFYAGLFKRHQKTCQRYHFFTSDVRPIFAQHTASEVQKRLCDEGLTQTYVGFAVVRPIKHAPLGRVVLSLPPDPPGHRLELMVRSQYSTHFAGSQQTVVGTAMTQQDSRVGACAQAAIWMAGRHFHQRHRGPWFSTAAITEAATILADIQLSRMLPAGSESLHPNNMLQALRAMQREPYFYIAELDHNSMPIGWNIPPEDIIHRYVDSGIPVILGIAPLDTSGIGHAVLATGVAIDLTPKSDITKSNPTRSEFVSHFIANDDQLGPNILIPIRAGEPYGDTDYNLTEHLQYIIVPLPKKVFLSAEAAEEIAWDLVQSYPWLWANSFKPGLDGSNVDLGDSFAADIAAGKVVARTYLTYGWKYKSRMLRNTCSDYVKDSLVYLELPRYVWVTEFGSAETLSLADPKQHKICAHTVIDATASKYWDSLLLFHCPGFMATFIHDQAHEFGEYKRVNQLIENDQTYLPKIRGEL